MVSEPKTWIQSLAEVEAGALQTGAKWERDRIVAWLRSDDIHEHGIADAIERGEHERRKP